jgi:hypothetical protein
MNRTNHVKEISMKRTIAILASTLVVTVLALAPVAQAQMAARAACCGSCCPDGCKDCCSDGNCSKCCQGK